VTSAFLNLEINGDGNCRYQQILPITTAEIWGDIQLKGNY